MELSKIMLELNIENYLVLEYLMQFIGNPIRGKSDAKYIINNNFARIITNSYDFLPRND